jgi:hypothetical protein
MGKIAKKNYTTEQIIIKLREIEVKTRNKLTNFAL